MESKKAEFIDSNSLLVALIVSQGTPSEIHERIKRLLGAAWLNGYNSGMGFAIKELTGWDV